MPLTKYNNKALRTIGVFVVGTGIFLANVSDLYAHENDEIEQLRKCARIDDQSERIDCYENLGQQLLAEEDSADEATVPQSTAGTDVTTTPSESVDPPVGVATKSVATVAVGSSSPNDIDTPTADRDAESETQVNASVTSCRRDNKGDYSFTLDNNQEWKQVDMKRLRYKECNFSVTIKKSFMGYKMRIVGEKGHIRVRRVK